ncbi:MAG: hypothetical protein SGI96_21305 [Bacteroidota bacterium]|nr:hypothetical protein [Bacteroidota bacterium]
MDELKIIDTFLSIVNSQDGAIGSISKAALLMIGAVAVWFITNKRKQIEIEKVKENTALGLNSATEELRESNRILTSGTKADLEEFKRFKRKR